jgi:hypothetical protein
VIPEIASKYQRKTNYIPSLQLSSSRIGKEMIQKWEVVEEAVVVSELTKDHVTKFWEQFENTEKEKKGKKR